jgi:hypothetical protein
MTMIPVVSGEIRELRLNKDPGTFSSGVFANKIKV